MVEFLIRVVLNPTAKIFGRDFARVMHTSGFRRLQRKTQLFPGDPKARFLSNSHERHSLEVRKIAKKYSVAAEFISLIRNIGKRYGVN